MVPEQDLASAVRPTHDHEREAAAWAAAGLGDIDAVAQRRADTRRATQDFGSPYRCDVIGIGRRLPKGRPLTATCDIRFSLQNRYARGGLANALPKLGMSNRAITFGGSATMSEKEISADDFVAADDDAIRTRLKRYLARHTVRAGDLVILDMEPGCVAPRHLGKFKGEQQDALIAAYRLRIQVARQELQQPPFSGIQLAMYQVIVPDGKGRSGAGFDERMSGYRAAGDQGMYDELDFICPVLYQRFGPDDAKPETLHRWIDASTKQGIDHSVKLTRSDDVTPIPLAPILSFWVFNPRSANDRKDVSPELVAQQLEIVQQATGVAVILFWSGSETKSEMRKAKEPVEPINIKQFLRDVGKLPWPGCP
jgi:hypothetical protein